LVFGYYDGGKGGPARLSLNKLKIEMDADDFASSFSSLGVKGEGRSVTSADSTSMKGAVVEGGGNPSVLNISE
jgi:hypothetical protein